MVRTDRVDADHDREFLLAAVVAVAVGGIRPPSHPAHPPVLCDGGGCDTASQRPNVKAPPLFPPPAPPQSSSYFGSPDVPPPTLCLEHWPSNWPPRQPHWTSLALMVKNYLASMASCRPHWMDSSASCWPCRPHCILWCMVSTPYYRLMAKNG